MKSELETADRFNSNKPKLSYIDLDSLMDCADVFAFGAKKYSRDNWKKGLSISSIFDSLMRHMAAIQRGEFLDPESGLPHHGHMMCNLIFISHVFRTHPEMIDLIDPKLVEKYYKQTNIPHGYITNTSNQSYADELQ